MNKKRANKNGEKGNNFAFIDSQNLNLGVKEMGWKLDFKKFRIYLEKQYGVNKAYLFIGRVKGQEPLYDALQRYGYKVIFKPTISYSKRGKMKIKGNVDIELALHAAAIEYENYDKAVIVSGDGDFYSLIKYLKSNSKLEKVIVPNYNYSSLLRGLAKDIFPLPEAKEKVKRKK